MGTSTIFSFERDWKPTTEALSTSSSVLRRSGVGQAILPSRILASQSFPPSNLRAHSESSPRLHFLLGASCVCYSYAYAYLLFASSIRSRSSGWFHPLLLVPAFTKWMIQHWSCSWSKSVFVSHHSIPRKEGNSCISIVHSQIYTNLLFHQFLVSRETHCEWRPIQATFILPLPLQYPSCDV